jgi:hypothetical protein
MSDWNEEKAVLAARAMTLAEQAQRAVVDSEESASKAADFAKVLRFQIDKIEAQRKVYVGPLNEVIGRINADARALREPLELALRAVKTQLTGWLRVKQAQVEAEATERRRQMETRALEQAQLLQDAGFRRQADTVVEQAAKASSIRAATAHVDAQRGELGAAGLTLRWTFDVTDLAALPLEYLMADTGKIRRYMQAQQARTELDLAGLKGKELAAEKLRLLTDRLKLPGVRFYREESASIR